MASKQEYMFIWMFDLLIQSFFIQKKAFLIFFPCMTTAFYGFYESHISCGDLFYVKFNPDAHDVHDIHVVYVVCDDGVGDDAGVDNGVFDRGVD